MLISWKWMAHTLSTTSSDSQVTKPKPDKRRFKRGNTSIEKKHVKNNHSYLDDVPFVYQSLTLHLLPEEKEENIEDLILFFCSLNAFSVTFPYCSKYFFTSSTVVLADSPPTKIFFVRVTILRRKYVILKKMKRKEKNGWSLLHTYALFTWGFTDLTCRCLLIIIILIFFFFFFVVLLNICVYIQGITRDYSFQFLFFLFLFVCRQSICCIVDLMNLVVIINNDDDNDDNDADQHM